MKRDSASLPLVALSLMLTACSVAGPTVPPTGPDRSVAAAAEPREQLAIRLRLGSAGFGTQVAEPNRLAYVQLQVTGQGLSSPMAHDGDTYLPVSGGSVTASFSDIRISNGAIRVVTARGFDAEHNPLPACEARAIYVSQTGTGTHTLTLERRQTLLGRIVAALTTSRSPLLASLDRVGLQAVLEQAMGYDAASGSFAHGPESYATAALVAALPPSSLPTATELNTAALGTQGRASISVTTPAGAMLTEDLTLSISDPDSRPLLVPYGTTSGTNFSFDVSPGDWRIEARNTAGTLVGIGSLSVAADGSLTPAQPVLPLTGVNLYVGSFHANTHLPYTQFGPTAAISDKGYFVVAWNSNRQDGNEESIHGQLYNRHGYKIGSEFRANDYTTGNQLQPAVAINDQGDFVVTWYSITYNAVPQDGDSTGVFAQRFNSQGQKQGPEFQVNTITTGAQDNATVAIAADGDFVIAWQGPDASGKGIYMRRFAANGSPLDATDQLVNVADLAGDQISPRLAYNAAGNLVVGWGAQSETQVRVYAPDGTAYGDKLVVPSGTAYAQGGPHVSNDEQGNFIVTWTKQLVELGPALIYARRFAADGTPLGNEFSPFQDTVSRGNQAVALNADGEFTIFWSQGTTSYSSRIGTENLPVGSALSFPTFNRIYQNEATRIVPHGFNHAGAFVSTYEDIEGPDLFGDMSGGIFAKRYDARGRLE